MSPWPFQILSSIENKRLVPRPLPSEGKPTKISKSFAVDSNNDDADAALNSLIPNITGIRVTLAEWNLPNGVLLELKGIQDYELRIFSPTLFAEDNSALRQKRKQEERKLNPAPKF
jgi:hypothetical protein